MSAAKGVQSKPVALVFGASGGIGTEISLRLSDKNYRLALVARDREKLLRLQERISESQIYVCDLRSSASVNEVFGELVGDVGIPSVIAHCAGSILLKAAHQLRDEEWEETLRLNLSSAFYVLRQATALWVRESIPGSMVFCSSAAASIGMSNHEAISAAKAGLEGLVRSAAATYASKGIRINAVAPGLVQTSLSSKITGSETALKASLSMHPLKKIGKPGQVASAACWLLDPEQEWVTGQVLGVDGGLSRLKTLA